MQKYFDINAPGHSIRCKLYCNDIHNIKKLVLFAHGLGGHKDNKVAEKFSVRLTTKYPTAALMTFDWPCHGGDVKKKLFLSDCDAYAQLVLDYIKEHFTENIYLYGTSFGAYHFLKYIKKNGNPFRRMALRSPAVNIYEIISGDISEEDEKKLQKGKDITIGHDGKITINQQFLDEIRTADIMKMDFLDYAEDILIIHGTVDEIVPFAVSRDFADENCIEFVAVDRADHRFQDPQRTEIATKSILDFYNL